MIENHSWQIQMEAFGSHNRELLTWAAFFAAHDVGVTREGYIVDLLGDTTFDRSTNEAQEEA